MRKNCSCINVCRSLHRGCAPRRVRHVQLQPLLAALRLSLCAALRIPVHTSSYFQDWTQSARTLNLLCSFEGRMMHLVQRPNLLDTRKQPQMGFSSLSFGKMSSFQFSIHLFSHVQAEVIQKRWLTLRKVASSQRADIGQQTTTAILESAFNFQHGKAQ